MPTLLEHAGSLSKVGIAKEVTFGVPVIPTATTPFTECTINPDPGQFSPPVLMGVREQQVFNGYGQYKFAGAVGGPLFPTNGIPFLVYAIGTDAVSGTVAPFSHAVTAQDLLSSMTIEKDLGGFQSEQYAGCRVNKIVISSAATDSAVSFTADVIAQSSVILNTPSSMPAVANENFFVFSDASLMNLFGNPIGAVITNISMTLDNQIKANYTHDGNHNVNFLTPTARHVSGTFTVVWTSLNDPTFGFYNEMFGGNTGSLETIWRNAGTGNLVQMNIPRIALKKTTDDIKINDTIMQTVSFEGFYDLADGLPSISMTVLNSQSTAY